MLPSGSRFGKKDEQPAIPAKYVRIGAACGVVLLIIIVYMFWPRKLAPTLLSPQNMGMIRPGMSKDDVMRIIDHPPGDYRTKNRGAPSRFDSTTAGADHAIWETDFGGYCVIFDSSGTVIRIERKPGG
jgi:hypothetical protein